MQKPTLLVLAAGMGSPYGSLKQMDGLGPGGETIMDYSVFDAIRAGFGKVVFVIRNSFADDFRGVFSQTRYKNQIEVAYVMQELENIPPLDSARGPVLERSQRAVRLLYEENYKILLPGVAPVFNDCQQSLGHSIEERRRPSPASRQTSLSPALSRLFALR